MELTPRSKAALSVHTGRSAGKPLVHHSLACESRKVLGKPTLFCHIQQLLPGAGAGAGAGATGGKPAATAAGGGDDFSSAHTRMAPRMKFAALGAWFWVLGGGSEVLRPGARVRLVDGSRVGDAAGTGAGVSSLPTGVGLAEGTNRWVLVSSSVCCSAANSPLCVCVCV